MPLKIYILKEGSGGKVIKRKSVFFKKYISEFCFCCYEFKSVCNIFTDREAFLVRKEKLLVVTL